MKHSNFFIKLNLPFIISFDTRTLLQIRLAFVTYCAKKKKIRGFKGLKISSEFMETVHLFLFHNDSVACWRL